MTKCLVCGKENNGWLCGECAAVCDSEQLCKDFCTYKIGDGSNEIWDSFGEDMNDETAFQIIDMLCSSLSESRKTYYKILYYVKNGNYIPKNYVDFVFENKDIVLGDSSIEESEKSRIYGLILNYYMNSYNFSEAEKIVAHLSTQTQMPKTAVITLIEFYIRTRRYDSAEAVINAFDCFSDDTQKQYTDLKKRRSGEKAEYFPKDLQNREEYFAFLDSINKTYKKPRSIPKPIPVSEYPRPQQYVGDHPDTFVAFDVETTGKDVVRDSITEIAAVKVVNGVIVDRFSELVRPIDKKIPADVEEFTGITNEDVINAREIWEVFPDFVKFIGDNVLLGYNNVAFDSQFLVRAGRYSNIVIENKHFDVMHFSLKFKEQLGISKAVKLVELGKLLNIENPQAHRALTDAETTAKIYLKLNLS